MSKVVPRFTMRNVSSTSTFRGPKDMQLILNVPQDGTPMFVTVIVTQEDGKELLYTIPYDSFVGLRDSIELLETVACMKRQEAESE